MFWFIEPLRLFFRNKHIVLLNPGADLNDSVLEFCVISTLIWRLRKTNWRYVVLAFYLSIYESIIYSIEKTLVYGTRIGDDGIFLVLSVVNSICNH